MIPLLAFISGASLMLWVWSRLWPVEMPMLGRRREQGPGQHGVPSPPAPGHFERLEQLAAAAGMSWTRRTFYQFALLGLGVGGVLGAVGLPIPAAIAVVAGFRAPAAAVGARRRQRAERFAAQLPQALQMCASTLRAGGTLLQAVEAMAAQSPAPLAEEFHLALQAIQLGTPVPDALEGIQARIGLREFGAVVVAARVTAELGGDAALTFERIAQSLVDAEGFRRSMRAYTTEGRMSAALITGLPFGLMGLLAVLAPGYFDPLFTTTGGRMLLAVCLSSIAAGWWLIRRITSPEGV